MSADSEPDGLARQPFSKLLIIRKKEKEEHMRRSSQENTERRGQRAQGSRPDQIGRCSGSNPVLGRRAQQKNIFLPHMPLRTVPAAPAHHTIRHTTKFRQVLRRAKTGSLVDSATQLGQQTA